MAAGDGRAPESTRQRPRFGGRGDRAPRGDRGGGHDPEELTGDGNYGSPIGTYLGLSQVPVVRVEKIGSQVSVEDVDSVFCAAAPAGIRRAEVGVDGKGRGARGEGARLVRGVGLSIRALASLDAPPGNVVCYAYLGRQSTGLARNREMGQ